MKAYIGIDIGKKKCDYCSGRWRKVPSEQWTSTIFEAELLNRDIELMNSRPCHPQTNGKLERFHGNIEIEIFYYEGLSAYVEYYN